MWLKLLIFGGLAYIIYKAFSGPGPDRAEPIVGNQARGQIDDIMVQDPYCQVYFPRQQGVSARVNGEVLYFCSKECMEKYIAQKTEE